MRLLRAALASLIVMASLTAAAFEPVEGTEVMLFDRGGQTLLGYGQILGGVLRLEVTGLREGETASELLMVVAPPGGEVLTVPAELTASGGVLVEPEAGESMPLETLLADGEVMLEVFVVPRPTVVTGKPGEAADDATTTRGEGAEEAAGAAGGATETAGGGAGAPETAGGAGTQEGEDRADDRGPPDDVGPKPGDVPAGERPAVPATSGVTAPEPTGRPPGPGPNNARERSNARGARGDERSTPPGQERDQERNQEPGEAAGATPAETPADAPADAPTEMPAGQPPRPPAGPPAAPPDEVPDEPRNAPPDDNQDSANVDSLPAVPANVV